MEDKHTKLSSMLLFAFFVFGTTLNSEALDAPSCLYGVELNSTDFPFSYPPDADGTPGDYNGINNCSWLITVDTGYYAKVSTAGYLAEGDELKVTRQDGSFFVFHGDLEDSYNIPSGHSTITLSTKSSGAILFEIVVTHLPQKQMMYQTVDHLIPAKSMDTVALQLATFQLKLSSNSTTDKRISIATAVKEGEDIQGLANCFVTEPYSNGTFLFDLSQTVKQARYTDDVIVICVPNNDYVSAYLVVQQYQDVEHLQSYRVIRPSYDLNYSLDSTKGSAGLMVINEAQKLTVNLINPCDDCKLSIVKGSPEQSVVKTLSKSSDSYSSYASMTSFISQTSSRTVDFHLVYSEGDRKTTASQPTSLPTSQPQQQTTKTTKGVTSELPSVSTTSPFTLISTIASATSATSKPSVTIITSSATVETVTVKANTPQPMLTLTIEKLADPIELSFTQVASSEYFIQSKAQLISIASAPVVGNDFMSTCIISRSGATLFRLNDTYDSSKSIAPGFLISCDGSQKAGAGSILLQDDRNVGNAVYSARYAKTMDNIKLSSETAIQKMVLIQDDQTKSVHLSNIRVHKGVLAISNSEPGYQNIMVVNNTTAVYNYTSKGNFTTVSINNGSVDLTVSVVDRDKSAMGVQLVSILFVLLWNTVN